jgi:dihydrolipoamide dehydrogenase
MAEALQKDVVVIGAGPAGYVCAIRLAQLGRRVTVIERGEVGGVCLNVGCIPSKALIHAGSVFRGIREAGEMGIEAGGEPRIDWPRLMAWKSSVVRKLTSGVGQLLRLNGCELVPGEARFTGPRTLEVESSPGGQRLTLEFKDCVIATGSRPSELPALRVDQKRILDSTGALALPERPGSLLCVGGGYIGLELGTFYAKVGARVTVVEALPGLLAGVDPELTRVVARKLEKLGVRVLLKTQVRSGRAGSESVEVGLAPSEKAGEETSERFDAVLVTVGRVPNTAGLGLERAGLQPDPKGFLEVDVQRRTRVPHVYAIGDVAGQPLLAHKGSKEGLIAAEAIAGRKTAYDVAGIPAVIFTDPEVATVGLTEAEARAKGFEPRVGAFPFAANGRSLSMGETEGQAKLVADARTGKLLGAQIVGPEASSLIAEAALALEMGATLEDIALTVHAHPTLPETLMEAAEVALGHAIHLFQRRRGP